MSSFPYYKQLDEMDCGPTCLRMISKFYGKTYSLQTLRERCYVTREGVSFLGLSDAAESIGFRSVGVRINTAQLSTDAPLPCIIHWNQLHFAVLYKVIKKRNNEYVFYVADPAHGLQKYNLKEFLSCWASSIIDNEKMGLCLFLVTTPDFYLHEDEKLNKSGFGYLFSYFKTQKKFITQLIVSLLVGSIIQLILPFLSQAIVDIGIQKQEINFIYLILIAQLVLMISRASVEFIRGWLLLHLGARVNISLISDFLVKLMKLPISFFDTKMTGDIIQRINDNSRIETFLTSSSLQILFSSFNLIIFGFILLFYSVKIFLVFIVGSIFYTIWVTLFLKKRRQLDNKHFALLASNQNNIYQLIGGMQEIKLNHCEKQKRWEWESIQVKTYKVNIKGLSLNQYQQAGAIFINESKNILITFLAASSVLKGDISLGSMLAIQYIIGQMNSPLDQMIGFFQSAQNAKLSLERLGEIHLKQDEEIDNESNIETIEGKKDITISDISFQYEGPHSAFVLKDINLIIPEGKITAIVGSSGSGKTTLLKLLLGFYKPVNGKISVGSNCFSNLSSHFWRQKCGVVMQDGFLFSDTIAKNISLSEEYVDKEKLLNAVNVANIKDFIESLPLGYNTRIGNEGVGLSQGQKQRLLIARAVYKNPQYIFFDEATNALDATNEAQIMKNLDLFFKGKTVVVVAHRLSTVKNADQIIVLEKGKLIEMNKHNELIKTKGFYYNLVKNQLELGN